MTTVDMDLAIDAELAHLILVDEQIIAASCRRDDVGLAKLYAERVKLILAINARLLR